MGKIPFQDEYENALKEGTDLDKIIVKLGELNDLSYKDLILLINTSSAVGEFAFALVGNAKSAVFLRETARLHGTGY